MLLLISVALSPSYDIKTISQKYLKQETSACYSYMYIHRSTKNFIQYIKITLPSSNVINLMVALDIEPFMKDNIAVTLPTTL